MKFFDGLVGPHPSNREDQLAEGPVGQILVGIQILSLIVNHFPFSRVQTDILQCISANYGLPLMKFFGEVRRDLLTSWLDFSGEQITPSPISPQLFTPIAMPDGTTGMQG